MSSALPFSPLEQKRNSPYARGRDKSASVASERSVATTSAAKEAPRKNENHRQMAAADAQTVVDVHEDLFHSVQLSISSMRSARSDLIAAQQLQQATFESSVANAELIDTMGKVLKAQIQLEGLLKRHLSADEGVLVAAAAPGKRRGEGSEEDYDSSESVGDSESQSDSESNSEMTKVSYARAGRQCSHQDRAGGSGSTIEIDDDAKENHQHNVKCERQSEEDDVGDDDQVQVTVQTTTSKTVTTA